MGSGRGTYLLCTAPKPTCLKLLPCNHRSSARATNRPYKVQRFKGSGGSLMLPRFLARFGVCVPYLRHSAPRCVGGFAPDAARCATPQNPDAQTPNVAKKSGNMPRCLPYVCRRTLYVGSDLAFTTPSRAPGNATPPTPRGVLPQPRQHFTTNHTTRINHL